MNKLLLQLESICKPFGIKVEEVGGGVELIAPDGHQFEPELHGLVSVQWDHEPMPNVYKRAIKDARDYGPRIKPCPADCPCKE
jgi:molecular chaperone GrpE (heat shock protein)